MGCSAVQNHVNRDHNSTRSAVQSPSSMRCSAVQNHVNSTRTMSKADMKSVQEVSGLMSAGCRYTTTWRKRHPSIVTRNGNHSQARNGTTQKQLKMANRRTRKQVMSDENKSSWSFLSLVLLIQDQTNEVSRALSDWAKRPSGLHMMATNY